MGNFETHLFWMATSCFNSRCIYRVRLGEKDFGFLVVRYLYICTKVLKMIHCFTRSQ